MANLVEIRDLKVEAKTDSGRVVEIIKGVDFEIAKGEIVALIGESGSGKTTIALTLMGHAREGCRISGGQVMVDGRDMATLSERERAKIRGTTVAYVPQSAAAAFNPSSTIMEQVIEVTRIHQTATPEEARKRAIELFRALSLPNPDTIGERYPHQVSGGQLQRLAAAMALIGGPKLVIFDEPTTALDVTVQAQIVSLLKDLQRRLTMAIVIITHDIGVVSGMATKVAVMYAGRLVEIGSVDDVLTRSVHPYTLGLLNSVPTLKAPIGSRFSGLPGSPPDLSRRIDGCAFMPRCSHAIPSCERGRPPLVHAPGDSSEHLAACPVVMNKLAEELA